MQPSSSLVRARLTSLFPSAVIETAARESAALERQRKIDLRMLVWTLVLGFAADGEARTIEGYRRAYNAATSQDIVASSFYDRFTPALETFLRALLDHALDETAVPHTVGPAFERFRDVVVADTTITRLQRFLAEFPASNHDESGVKLYLVHVLGSNSVLASHITDERCHDSPLFETGSWLRGRLLLFDMGFFNYRRFALIDENDGFFVTRVKRQANPPITAELATYPGRALPLVGECVQDVLGELQRATLDVEVDLAFERRAYNGSRSTDSKRFRVVGIRDETVVDDYRLYVTNLPAERFSPADVSAIYRARWEVELVFRELKSRYSLGRFTTTKPHIVRIQVLAALLTLVVSNALQRTLLEFAADQGEGAIFPTERWATALRSVAQLILMDLAVAYRYPPPDLDAFLIREARQPSPGRLTLLQEVNQALSDASPA